jgi:hypothetical protein
LVVEFGLQTYSIIPVYQGQRGFPLFLVVDRGHHQEGFARKKGRAVGLSLA